MRRLLGDLRHVMAAWDASAGAVVIGALARWPLYPRIRAVSTFRASSWCWHHQLKPLGLWLQNLTIGFSGAEIHPAADIGPGLLLVHTVGIVVGHDVVAGDGLVLYQGVTLGHTGRGDGQPKIGSRVRIGAGAKVLGPIVIGDEAWVGANAVVLADVPAGATVGGIWRGAEP